MSVLLLPGGGGEDDIDIYPHLDMTMLTSRITKLSRNHRMQNICTCTIVTQLDSDAADS